MFIKLTHFSVAYRLSLRLSVTRPPIEKPTLHKHTIILSEQLNRERWIDAFFLVNHESTRGLTKGLQTTMTISFGLVLSTALVAVNEP